MCAGPRDVTIVLRKQLLKKICRLDLSFSQSFEKNVESGDFALFENSSISSVFHEIKWFKFEKKT